ncbi:MAG: phenylalanine--tRNA ligase subunit beta [Thermodesulfobacteriota bacterium]
MYLNYKWLLEFTPFSGSPGELAHCLTMLGLEVEETFNPFFHLEDIVVGYIQSVQPHPNADNLRICEVDTGDSKKSIVCGAPNAKEGQRVPVALQGSKLPSGQVIKDTKIRGSLSQGMICSEHELSLGQDKSGIMVLPQEVPLGDPLTRALDLDTTILDIDITPNRADCLSILGIARDVAAYYGLPLNLPSMPINEELPYCSEEIDINIANPTDCPLYQTRILKDVQVDTSPDWLRYRLIAMGLRPINNIVDITNYVLLEFGQPLHAFDKELVGGDQINVDRAREGQRFTTLDGEERELSSQNLLIQDRDKPVALAGIMGGANSEINPRSSQVLLECAIFNSTLIRKSARKLNISTDSSYRFERGVDQPGATNALDRCTSLLQQIAGGRVLQGVAKNEPIPWEPPRINFRPKRSWQLLGLEIKESRSREILQNLGCSIERSGEQVWEVTPPSHRLDLEREVDLVEEVGRVFGLENIPANLPKISKQLEQGNLDQEYGQASYAFLRKVQSWARGLGLQETVNYSFVGHKGLERLNLLDENTIALYNPLTADQNTLRPMLAPGLLTALRYNLSQGNKDLHLFEVARTFDKDSSSETRTRERNKLGIVLHGLRNPGVWPHKIERMDFLDLKGYMEHFLESMGVYTHSISRQQEHAFLDPAIAVRIGDKEIAQAGKLRTELVKNYQGRNEIWIAEFDLDRIYNQYMSYAYSYRSWPKFPPVHRDMTVIASYSVKYSDIIDLVKASNVDYLQDCTLIDLYQPEGSRDRHFTFRMTYRHTDRTLTDEEVDEKHSRLGDLIIDNLAVRFP